MSMFCYQCQEAHAPEVIRLPRRSLGRRQARG